MNKQLLALGYFLAALSTNAHAMRVLEDGSIQFGGIIGKRIEMESFTIISDGLTITGEDFPVSLEAYAKNNKAILRINGTEYNGNIQGTYFSKNNQLYDAETGQRISNASWLNTYLPAGCVILVIGGTLYILHKNGVLKRAYDFLKEHTYATAVTASLAAVAGVAAYSLKK